MGRTTTTPHSIRRGHLVLKLWDVLRVLHPCWEQRLSLLCHRSLRRVEPLL